MNDGALRLSEESLEDRLSHMAGLESFAAGSETERDALRRRDQDVIEDFIFEVCSVPRYRHLGVGAHHPATPSHALLENSKEGRRGDLELGEVHMYCFQRNRVEDSNLLAGVGAKTGTPDCFETTSPARKALYETSTEDQG